MRRQHNILHYIETGGPGGAETILLNIAGNIDRQQYHSRVVLHKSDWLFNQLSKHEIETEIIPSKYSWDISFLIKFIGYCRRHKIDLIHSHLFGANLYGCLAGAILRIPVIATFHNELFFLGRSEKFLAIKSFIIRRFASRMVFVAMYMKRDYADHSMYPENKSLVIYNGIELMDDKEDFDSSVLRRELGISDHDLLVGHVANFRAPKGHRYLLEAASLVCDKIPGVRFLLIGEEGDGTIKREIEDIIAEKDLRDNIKLLGFRKDVVDLLRIIDVFVLSSISEGLPLSVIEAMASGKPVVATEVGGLSEIVVQDQTGYLVEPGNPAALADRLVTLLENRDLRNRMGRAGRAIVEDRYSLKVMIDSYQNLYGKLIERA
jgi:glycosyltransferase involved in cell wall biosynthesis